MRLSGAILISFFFVFLRENFAHTKSIKITKRQISDFRLDVFYEHKKP